MIVGRKKSKQNKPILWPTHFYEYVIRSDAKKHLLLTQPHKQTELALRSVGRVGNARSEELKFDSHLRRKRLQNPHKQFAAEVSYYIMINAPMTCRILNKQQKYDGETNIFLVG